MTTQFGDNESFSAKTKAGYLCLICGGGTGFATPVDGDIDAIEKLLPILNADERDVIKYCNKNNWPLYDYYGERVLRYGDRKEIIIKDFNK